MRAARALNLTMTEWDHLSQDDKDWALAADSPKCPVCGGDDPDEICQNPEYRWAWEVEVATCYKQRAVVMAMEKYKNHPFAGVFVPKVRLNIDRALSS